MAGQVFVTTDYIMKKIISFHSLCIPSNSLHKVESSKPVLISMWTATAF